MKRLFFALVAFISLATSVFADKAISRTTVRPENIMSVALVDGKPVILAIEDGKFYIYDDGKKSEPYDDNRNFFVSDNGKILLCVMKKDDETFIFHGKKKYGPYPLFDEPYESYILAFSKDGKTVYHQAKADDGSRIVYKNGKEIRRLHSKLYNNIIHSPEFDRIIAFVDGESETEQYIYHEGKRFGPYGDTLVSAISIEGKDRIFYSAKTKEGWFIFGENEKIGPYDEVSNLCVYGENGNGKVRFKLSYAAKTEDGWFIFHEGKKIGPFETIECVRVFNNENGKRLAYATTSGDELYVHDNEKTYGPYETYPESLNDFSFMPKTGKLFYTIGNGYGMTAYIDGEEFGTGYGVHTLFKQSQSLLFSIGNSFYDEGKKILELSDDYYVDLTFYDGEKIGYALVAHSNDTDKSDEKYICTSDGVKIDTNGRFGYIYAFSPDKTAFAYDVTEQNADGEYAIYCKVHIDGTSYPGQIQKDGTVIYIKDGVIYTRGK